MFAESCRVDLLESKPRAGCLPSAAWITSQDCTPAPLQEAYRRVQAKLMQIPKLGSDNHEYAVVCTNMPFSSLVAHWKRRSNPLFILARPKLPRPMISSASYPRDEPTDLQEQPQASKAPNKLESSRSNQLPPANFKPHTCVWLHLVAGSSLQRSMSQRLREAGL